MTRDGASPLAQSDFRPLPSPSQKGADAAQRRRGDSCLAGSRGCWEVEHNCDQLKGFGRESGCLALFAFFLEDDHIELVLHGRVLLRNIAMRIERYRTPPQQASVGGYAAGATRYSRAT
jgi:hypothetical protein